METKRAPWLSVTILQEEQETLFIKGWRVTTTLTCMMKDKFYGQKPTQFLKNNYVQLGWWNSPQHRLARHWSINKQNMDDAQSQSCQIYALMDPNRRVHAVAQELQNKQTPSMQSRDGITGPHPAMQQLHSAYTMPLTLDHHHGKIKGKKMDSKTNVRCKRQQGQGFSQTHSEMNPTYNRQHFHLANWPNYWSFSGARYDRMGQAF